MQEKTDCDHLWISDGLLRGEKHGYHCLKCMKRDYFPVIFYLEEDETVRNLISEKERLDSLERDRQAELCKKHGVIIPVRWRGL